MAQQPLDEIQRKRLEDSVLDEFDIEQATPEHRRSEWRSELNSFFYVCGLFVVKNIVVSENIVKCLIRKKSIYFFYMSCQISSQVSSQV